MRSSPHATPSPSPCSEREARSCSGRARRCRARRERVPGVLLRVGDSASSAMSSSPPGRQRLADRAQGLVREREVVDDVERDHEVGRRRLERRRVARLERGVRQLACSASPRAVRDHGRRLVVADDARRGVASPRSARPHVRRPLPTSTTSIPERSRSTSPGAKPKNRLQRAVRRSAYAQLRLPHLEPLHALPGHAAALAEHVDDVVLHLAEEVKPARRQRGRGRSGLQRRSGTTACSAGATRSPPQRRARRCRRRAGRRATRGRTAPQRRSPRRDLLARRRIESGHRVVQRRAGGRR